MDFQFSQYETESKLNDILKFGDETDVAEKLGRSSSIISQMCNPHDERASDFFKAAQFIAALCEVAPERGRKALQLFNSLVERHLPESAPDHHDAVKDFNRELREFLDAAMCERNPEVCLMELDDVIEFAVELKKSYRARVEAESAFRNPLYTN